MYRVHDHRIGPVSSAHSSCYPIPPLLTTNPPTWCTKSSIWNVMFFTLKKLVRCPWSLWMGDHPLLRSLALIYWYLSTSNPTSSLFRSFLVSLISFPWLVAYWIQCRRFWGTTCPPHNWLDNLLPLSVNMRPEVSWLPLVHIGLFCHENNSFDFQLCIFLWIQNCYSTVQPPM